MPAEGVRSVFQPPHAHMESQTKPAESSAATPGIPEVMAAIATCQVVVATCQATLTSKIEAVQLDVGHIQQDIDNVVLVYC